MAAKTVSLAGNAFITTSNAGATEVIDASGLANWTNADTITTVYFRMAAATLVTIGLGAALRGSNNSTVTVIINGFPFLVTLAGTAAKIYPVGTVNVAVPGYVKVTLQGVTKDGGYFGDVSGLSVTTTSALNYANDPANYEFSRRGPSVHMNYNVPDNTEYFYTEVTVPVNQDVVGSFFMAESFDGGYCGMQVQANERWMIFSVWDAVNGQQTALVSRGAGVVTERFDGEGKGQKSYLVFPWVTGSTYKFITRIRPEVPGSSTLYSAWFFASPANAWRYLATWRRPSTNTYHYDVYSALENFEQDNGYKGRKVLYGNQWARNVNGNWSELLRGNFTGDDTANNRQRMDYAGGLDNGRFYLRNGGFFDDYAALDQNFNRPATGGQPPVDVNMLPNN